MSKLMLVTSLDAKLYHTFPILQTFTPKIEHLIVHIYLLIVMIEQFRRWKTRNPDSQRSCVKNRDKFIL